MSSNQAQRVKRQRNHISYYRFLAYFCSVLLLASSLFFYLWPRMQVIKLSYRWEQLQAKKQEKLKQNQMFMLEIATLSSLQRIESIAKESLGMIEPRSEQIIIVELEQGK